MVSLAERGTRVVIVTTKAERFVRALLAAQNPGLAAIEVIGREPGAPVPKPVTLRRLADNRQFAIVRSSFEGVGFLPTPFVWTGPLSSTPSRTGGPTAIRARHHRVPATPQPLDSERGDPAMSVPDRVRAVIEPIVAAKDLDLFDLEQAGPVLRVTVDKAGGST